MTTPQLQPSPRRGALVRNCLAALFALVAGVLVTDLALAQTTSTTLIAKGAVWKYLDNGSDQGTAWRAKSFADGSWASGAGQLGYGDGDEATRLGFGPNPNAKYITTYFRKAFTLDNPSQVKSLAINVLRDDGALVYLNGVRVIRSNMPGGTITSTTGALRNVRKAREKIYHHFSINKAALVTGRNVLAVEVHQVDARSADLSFDLELIATFSPALPSTTTALASSANPSLAGQNITLTATVTPATATGSVTFKHGATTIGTGTLNAGVATMVRSFSTTGAHSLTAVYAGSADFAGSTSVALNQNVNKVNSSTALSSSANPSVAGESVTLTATVTGASPGGTVTFKDGATTLGTRPLSAGVATMTRSFAATGAHSLTAV
ncbi:MAG: Ig-like domain repeat protein [Burkholderiales bacterium]|nr:Ig-like domain repeat protein [Burkholderiales bacterium]